jgi:hypothetical protein
MSEALVVIAQADDLAARARERQRVLDEQAKRNNRWLRAHWAEILPRAQGKSVAVAGEEAFIADTDEEARAMAQAAHPEDEGLIYTSVWRGQTPADNFVTIQLVDDPIVNARARAQDERIKRNLDWLQAHWGDLLPQALGKHVAVAGEEAFVADTSEEAWAMAKAAHPEDDGAFSKYVSPKPGPRIDSPRVRVRGTPERGEEPTEIARWVEADREPANRNADCLLAYWPSIVPRARGKHLAIAGEEAFIADTQEEALALARAAHPEDDGIVYRYVYPDGSLAYNRVTLEWVDEPSAIAQARARDERIKRNSDWLQAHWDHLWPQARGKYLAVAGQEAFVADTSEEARARARAAHPEDDGAFCQYVSTKRGPRIYAHRG